MSTQVVETGGRPEMEGGRWLRRAKDLTPDRRKGGSKDLETKKDY